MALRAIAVLREVCAEMEELCPDAWIFNYTNPVNVVAEAITHHSPVKVVSLCEGPIYFAHEIAESAGLDEERLQVTMVGLNHACWGVEHHYDGEDPLPLIAEAWERRRDDPALEPHLRRQLQLAATMGAVPADYFQYYYFTDEVLEELRAKPTTRAEDILSWAPDYWQHYSEQAQTDDPQLDPSRSRGGIHELELAIDVMDAIFNDKDETHPVNMPNAGGALPGFPDDLVVEVLGRCHAGGIDVIPAPPLPRHVRGLVEMLGEYQALAAETAWAGTRSDAVRALTANPLVRQVEAAERVYDALAAAHRPFLPDRLLAG
jgi:6-phospho-beta-glucosidase